MARPKRKHLREMHAPRTDSIALTGHASTETGTHWREPLAVEEAKLQLGILGELSAVNFVFPG
ncbi:hypothetical protein GCM10009582_31560 [Arthrobacter flavus]